MKGGFRLGRIFGINIQIDWSWILIFILISWSLSISFGDSHRNWSVGLQWGLAILAALIFFTSVLAHEIAHSLMARYRGVPVKSITLFLFGGVSNIQREPESPLAEFLITIVGPLTSFIAGIVFLLLASLTTSGSGVSITNTTAVLSQFDPLTTLLVWLGSVNILVGFFNLIPGFPLDGGRVLRSILWAITDNLRLATRWASYVGQGIAWLMILAGIAMFFNVQIPFFGSGFVNGIWLVFIGWFLNSAAVQSYQQIVVQDILEGVEVERIMRTHPAIVSPDISIDTLVNDYIMGSGEDAFPVVASGDLVGMVTLQEARHVPREDWQRKTVREIMTPYNRLSLVEPEEDVSDVLNRLQSDGVGELVVAHGHELLGVLRRQDIMRWLQVHSENMKI